MPQPRLLTRRGILWEHAHMTSKRVFRIRHHESGWSLWDQHTSVTDIPLTENGRRVAMMWKPVLSEEAFALVLTSPLRRARETCELAGFSDRAEIDPDLTEWNYGEYEGLTPQQIHATRRAGQFSPT